MLKNFLQLTRKQQIITIVVYTVIAAITMYLGYNQTQTPVVTTNSLTGFQSAQLPSAPDNSILGWLNFHKIGLVFAPVSVLILDYFKIHLIRKRIYSENITQCRFNFIICLFITSSFSHCLYSCGIGDCFNFCL